MRPHHSYFAVLSILLISLASGAAQAQKPRWGSAATRFMKQRLQVRGDKLYINVRSFGRHYKEQEQWGKATTNTVELRFDPSLNYGHTLVRVGGKEYQMLGSKAAQADDFSTNNILNNGAGAVFRASPRDVAKIHKGFKQVVESARKHNFPAFTITGRTLSVKQQPDGCWEIQNTRRRPETRLIQAKLVTRKGKQYLESPNGYRQAVTGLSTDANGRSRLQVDSMSCTSFAVDTLNSLQLSSLPRFQRTASARGLARTLMGRSARSIKPDAVTHYSVDGPMPTDLQAAVEKVLDARGQ